MPVSKTKKKPVRSPRIRKRSKSPLDSLDSRSILLEAAAKVGDGEVSQVVRKAKKIEEKATHGALAAFLGEIRDLLALVTDYASGRYRSIPFGSIAAVAGALLYVLSPVDLIPDVIPGIGYVDDAGVIAACLRLVKFDLAKYRASRKG